MAVSDDDLHVTIAYSRAPVDWDIVGTGQPELEVSGGARSIDLFGRPRVDLAVCFESFQLATRWQQLRDAGASWDWRDYRPHITIAYNMPNPPNAAEVARILPYTGPLLFGPERFAAVGQRGRV